ncbi:spermidine/putrescine ABC transporter substrate-binding protein [Vibrio aquaticus]|uniref:Spermidine/putrescine ABC transporter substrate-binding protein n=1 Tax=Vibrio aquaticus TaxID=2496559 RepID=A0A3S0QCL2_9VIBR|nr:spermidine/putrescine ABC transporter substrate-binding protein [Vibrio aquaticus]RTZ15086.1 spermidine/putrescine ABC transporter substrate-binding protein [Vibrio aquaticus]
MRVLFLPLLFFTSSVSLAQALNIYMWEDTLSPQVRAQWEQKSGHSITLSHFDNDDERSQLMMKSIQLPFDVVVLDNVSAQIYGKLGTFENLSTLSNRVHNDKQWNQTCGDYAVPYFWGSVGVAYRKDIIATPPKTWSEFVKPPRKLSGKVGMLNDSVETFLPIFYSLGISPTTENAQEIHQAYPAMVEFNQDVLTYEYILSYIRSQSDPDTLQMTLAYSGDQYSLNRYFGQDNWGYVIPEGEVFLWVDCLAVSAHSDNKQAARAFLNYLMDPKVAAKNAIDIKAATPNRSATKLLPEWYLNDASLFPSQERLANAQIDSQLSAENISLRTKIINRLLKDHEAKH